MTASFTICAQPSATNPIRVQCFPSKRASVCYPISEFVYKLSELFIHIYIFT